jgi:hypothetical protein
MAVACLTFLCSRCAKQWRAMLVLLFFAAAGSARAQDYYFVMVFSSERDSPMPKYSHTWATFVKATPVLPQGFVLEAHTISWLPENGVMRVVALLPEPGRNFDLESTLRWALNSGQRLFMWGPYQVDPALYDRARAQKALLESGCVRYKVIDTGRRSDRVSNCIHAVAAVADGHRLRATTLQWGEPAGALVTRTMEPWLINPAQTHDWVASALGLDRYAPDRRSLDAPRRRLTDW